MNRAVKIFSLFLIVPIAVFSFLSFNEKAPVDISTKEIFNKLFKAVDNVKTLKYKQKITECIKGKCLNYQSEVKLQRKPRKLYLYLKGPEVLWVEGWNNGKALVNPAAFPYVNLNLDPTNSLMCDNQHHTIHEIGYEYMMDILAAGMKSAGNSFDKAFVLKGEEKRNERMCYKISITNENFSFKDYTVLKGETMVTIAKKLKVSEYMILEHNPKSKSYRDIKEGQVIKVPSAYAKSVLLFVDKELFVPIGISIFDDKGLYEDYQYFDLQVNPVIADEEFTKSYKGYHF